MNVDPETRHFQTQAVTMLAIATGAIGFGLFGAEFRVSEELLPAMKFAAGGYALLWYWLLTRSVKNILDSGEVTGRQIVEGPLTYMFLVVVFVVSVFVVGIFEGRFGAGSPPPM